MKTKKMITVQKKQQPGLSFFMPMKKNDPVNHPSHYAYRIAILKLLNCKTFKLLIITLLVTLQSYSQLTLEQSYYGYCQGYRISADDFVFTTCIKNELKIYSSTHAILHTVSLPGPAKNFYIQLVTKTLFNNDNDYEIVYSYQDSITYKPFVKVIQNNGNVLYEGPGTIAFLKSNTITKMITNSDYLTSDAKVYSLPGEIIPNYIGKKEATNADPAYPNPSINFITIPYILSTYTGSLTIYNANMQQVAKYAIDNTFKDLLIDTTTLPSGMYFYNTSNSQSSMQTFIINK